ncbi:MAG: cation:proton antiporter, partial [Halobacteriales archaeon]|nr:cation:proton antiporter [Halobacteriales archaeon]
AFLLAAVLLGIRLVPRGADLAAERLQAPGALVVLGVAFALAMAWLGEQAGLAAIVGAFVAGILVAPARHAHRLFEDVRPVGALFVPLFFVTLGMRVDLTALAGHGLAVLAIGLGLAVAAVVAKLVCGLGVVGGQASRLVVGVGMVPRGEVGLLFAATGLAAGLLANWQYAALLLAVFLTTLATPPMLRALAGRFTHDASPALAGTERLAHILEP